MERAEWLRHMRAQAEALYDRLSPAYWVTFGFYENAAHLAYLQKFLALVKGGGGAARTGEQPCMVLSAACGAGRYDGILLEAGCSVVGIDQSAGMLARAREHFPASDFPFLRYEQAGLQEVALQPGLREAFDGATCIDALEHICPEDYPGILRGLGGVLKPGGVLYFTVDVADAGALEASYQRAVERGLPAVLGEVVDEVDQAYEQVKAIDHSRLSGALTDMAVYHYYPPLDQVRAWLAQAGLSIVEEGEGSGYHHFIAKKNQYTD